MPFTPWLEHQKSDSALVSIAACRFLRMPSPQGWESRFIQPSLCQRTTSLL